MSLVTESRQLKTLLHVCVDVTHRPRKHCHSGLFCEASSESLAPNNFASNRTTARRSSPSLLCKHNTHTHLFLIPAAAFILKLLLILFISCAQTHFTYCCTHRAARVFQPLPWRQFYFIWIFFSHLLVTHSNSIYRNGSVMTADSIQRWLTVMV